jgi:hypothetical protein
MRPERGPAAAQTAEPVGNGVPRHPGELADGHPFRVRAVNRVTGVDRGDLAPGGAFPAFGLYPLPGFVPTLGQLGEDAALAAA